MIEVIIKASGYKKKYLAEMLDISLMNFIHKLKGRNRFKEIELKELAETLGIPLRTLRYSLPKGSLPKRQEVKKKS